MITTAFVMLAMHAASLVGRICNLNVSPGVRLIGLCLLGAAVVGLWGLWPLIGWQP